MSTETIALIVASILGSTGIASFLASSTKLTRTARLRTAIAATKESLVGLDPASSAYRATQASITVMSLEVASYALVRIPVRQRILLFFMSYITFASLFLFVTFISSTSNSKGNRWEAFQKNFWSFENNDSRSPLILIAPFVAIIIYILILSLFLSLRNDSLREKFVAEALKRDTVDYSLVTKHGRQLRGKHSADSLNSGEGSTDFSQLRHFAPHVEVEVRNATKEKRPWWRFNSF